MHILEENEVKDKFIELYHDEFCYSKEQLSEYYDEHAREFSSVYEAFQDFINDFYEEGLQSACDYLESLSNKSIEQLKSFPDLAHFMLFGDGFHYYLVGETVVFFNYN